MNGRPGRYLLDTNAVVALLLHGVPELLVLDFSR